MRKLFFTLLCVCFIFGLSFGQDNSVKPKKGTKGLSFSVIGLSNLGVGGVGAGIGGKYWHSEKLVYKASLGFRGSYYTLDGRAPGYSKEKAFSGSISILPGIEYHYFPSSRISPYWGAGINFSISRETRNLSLPPAPLPGMGTRTESWIYSVGASLSLGVEWFIVKNLSIAGEYQATLYYRHDGRKTFVVPGPNITEVTKSSYNLYNLSWGTSALVATFYF